MADINVSGPDGSKFTFPEGTSADTIKGALSKHYGAPAEKDTAPAAEPLRAEDTFVLPSGEIGFTKPQQQAEYEQGKTSQITDMLKGAAKTAIAGVPGIVGDVEATGWQRTPVLPGTPLPTPAPLFKKLDDAVVAEEEARLGS